MFAILVALVSSKNSKTRKMARIGVGLFLVIHGLLHILFEGHPAYEFSSILSNVLIFGGSIFGVVYLALEWIGKRSYAT